MTFIYVVVKHGEGMPVEILGVYYSEEKAEEVRRADPEFNEEPDDYGTHIWVETHPIQG